MLNGMLHYQYFITALHIIIYSNIVCFCLQTLEMYLEQTYFDFNIKLSRQLFQKTRFCIFILIIVIFWKFIFHKVV